jgi:hypothetical protein
MGLSSLSVVSLADARQRAAEARKWRDQALNPIGARDALQVAKSVATFKDCGEAYVTTHAPGVRKITNSGNTRSKDTSTRCLATRSGAR